MSKNIVFMHTIGYKPEYEVSKQSWSLWCDKNNVEFVLLDESIDDDMFPNYQRYYLFDLLENSDKDFDRVLTIDADTIIHPNAPNIFEETDENKLYFVHDTGSYDWMLRGMEWYSKELFDGLWFDYLEYGNSGFQLLSKKHIDFYKKMQELWSENKDVIIDLSQKYGLGKEQALWNLMIRKHNIEYELLPYKWNMTNMMKKEILTNGLFISLGWVYHFNGLPVKEEGTLPYLMQNVWSKLNEITE
tara:strand:+ start:482 stop:1216 length:735 start_codon:yes stop_codon:yes gene_type:complete